VDGDSIVGQDEVMHDLSVVCKPNVRQANVPHLLGLTGYVIQSSKIGF
jgi:hypothetical protein